MIKKRKDVGLTHSNDRKTFIEYSNDIQVLYKNIEKYNPGNKQKILIVFDDMIADMISNKKLNSILTEFLLDAEEIIFQTFL